VALTTEQCEILAALVAPQTAPPERTTDVLARRLNLNPRRLASRLEELQHRSPPLVRLRYDDEWQVHAWAATEEGRRACNQWCLG
jgi:hypothetical protein